MTWLVGLVVGFFRGLYSEWSRDRSHKNQGKAEANLKHEQDAKDKMEAADNARHSVTGELSDDPNNRDN